MLSAQSQDKRTAIACKQLFSLADTPEKMIKLTREQIIEAIRPAGLHNAKSKNILATSHKVLIECDGKVTKTTKSLVFVEGNLISKDKIILSASGIWKILNQ